MPDATTIAIVLGTFLIAGTVKGVIGLGLPSVSLAILALAIDLPTAMVLIVVPSIVTNIWQAVAGGNGRMLIRRLWPFLASAAATVWIGALALTRVNLAWLSALLGVLIATYAAVNLFGWACSVKQRNERWIGPLVGLANGLLTGMTGAYLMPGVIYLRAVGLEKNALVQAMGMLFLVSTVSLAAALGGIGWFTTDLGGLSVGALIPAVIGMAVGQQIRKRLSEHVFRNAFLVSLLVLGGYIIVKGIFQG